MLCVIFVYVAAGCAVSWHSRECFCVTREQSAIVGKCGYRRRVRDIWIAAFKGIHLNCKADFSCLVFVSWLFKHQAFIHFSNGRFLWSVFAWFFPDLFQPLLPRNIFTFYLSSALKLTGCLWVSTHFINFRWCIYCFRFLVKRTISILFDLFRFKMWFWKESTGVWHYVSKKVARSGGRLSWSCKVMVVKGQKAEE